MTITISKVFIEEYRDNVVHLAQQAVNKFRDHVTTVSSNGEAYNFDRLSAIAEPTEKSGRRQATAYIDDTWSRRVAQPKTYNFTMSIEHEDKVQTIHAPESEYVKAQAMAMNRSYDDILIAAATGTALDGDGAANAFPAGQKVGDGTTAITFDSITAIQEIFMQNEIDMSVPKVAFVGPTQVRKLMQLTEQTSADYVQREALQRLSSTGIVPNWMGFTWIVSNRLLAPSVGEISCLFFTKQALGLAINQDIFTRIGENPSMQYMIQLFAQYTAGAVRIEDEQIVHAHYLDSL